MLRNKFIGLIRLFRPELPFAAGVTVLVGEMVALVYFTLKLLRSKDSKEGVFAMRGIYLGFTAGMIVYILGQFLM
jgi:hypothetical protein